MVRLLVQRICLLKKIFIIKILKTIYKFNKTRHNNACTPLQLNLYDLVHFSLCGTTDEIVQFALKKSYKTDCKNYLSTNVIITNYKISIEID